MMAASPHALAAWHGQPGFVLSFLVGFFFPLSGGRKTKRRTHPENTPAIAQKSPYSDESTP
jgi:hypothetical protein